MMGTGNPECSVRWRMYRWYVMAPTVSDRTSSTPRRTTDEGRCYCWSALSLNRPGWPMNWSTRTETAMDDGRNRAKLHDGKSGGCGSVLCMLRKEKVESELDRSPSRSDSFWHPSGGFRRRHRFRRAEIRKNDRCSSVPHRRPSAVRIDSWPSCPSSFVAADSSFRRKRRPERIAKSLCLH